MTKKIMLTIEFLLLGFVLLIWLINRAASRAPDKLGPTVSPSGETRLHPCPDSPNCVHSRAQAAEHRIAPIQFSDKPAQAWERLTEVLKRMPGTRIISHSDHYLHVQCRTPLMGFIDDVEFLLSPNASSFEVRSASRLGHSDFGVNRKRVEKLRAEIQATIE